MGHGIAQIAAAAGCDVTVFESSKAALDRGLGRIEHSLERIGQRAVDKGKQTAAEAAEAQEQCRSRIRGTLKVEDLGPADLVIEAIVEDLDAKHALFEQLGRSCGPSTVFASNTSSFPITAMAERSDRPKRLIGMHFFNPVQLMQLVEIIHTKDTEPDVLRAAADFVSRCGKTAVRCSDTPGFIVNRLLVPLMVQAMQMVDRGDAGAADVDAAMQLGCGHPMGPITLADYVGLDTTLAILEGWQERHPEEPAFAIPESLRAHVAAGNFGRKTGRGYYRWDGDRRADP